MCVRDENDQLPKNQPQQPVLVALGSSAFVLCKSTHSSATVGWMPTVEHLSTSTAAIHEWVGFWVYDQLGRFDPVDASESSDQQ